MANICINRFYCSTDNEANYEKILYGLGDRFDLYDLDGRDNWMRGEFDSKWCYPEEAIAAMMKTLEKDPTLHIEIVSCEPGCNTSKRISTTAACGIAFNRMKRNFRCRCTLHVRRSIHRSGGFRQGSRPACFTTMRPDVRQYPYDARRAHVSGLGLSYTSRHTDKKRRTDRDAGAEGLKLSIRTNL